MDVRQWLNSTLSSAPPASPKRADFPVIIRAAGGAEARGRHIRPKEHCRERDSSIIERRMSPERASPRMPSPRRYSARRRRAFASSSSTSTCTHSSFSSSSPSSSSSAPPPPPAKNYERKARHKTKPDKYIPREKGKRKRDDDGDNEASGPKPRKKRKKRKRDGGHGLVHNFKSKKISKDRLTLDSNLKVGLYKQGRASLPVRGQGLPDLVFSEMKFLHKQDEDEDCRNDKEGHSKEQKNRNKERKQTQNEEISAYFGRPTRKDGAREQDRDGYPLRRRARHSDVSSHQTSHRPQATVGGEKETSIVELPSRPFLGFGSKGYQPHSATCVTWSDSPHPVLPRSPMRLPHEAAESLEPDQRRKVAARRHEENFSLQARENGMRAEAVITSTTTKRKRSNRAQRIDCSEPKGPAHSMTVQSDNDFRHDQHRLNDARVSMDHQCQDTFTSVSARNKEHRPRVQSKQARTPDSQSVKVNERRKPEIQALSHPKTSSSPLRELLHVCQEALRDRCKQQKPPTQQLRQVAINRARDARQPDRQDLALVGRPGSGGRPPGPAMLPPPSIYVTDSWPAEHGCVQDHDALMHPRSHFATNELEQTQTRSLHNKFAERSDMEIFHQNDPGNWDADDIMVSSFCDRTMVMSGYDEEVMHGTGMAGPEGEIIYREAGQVNRGPDEFAGFWRPNKLY